MVNFTFLDRANNKVSLGVGLTAANVQRMMNGDPILVRLSKLDLGTTLNGDIMIYFGSDDADLRRQLGDFIGPDTKVTNDQEFEHMRDIDKAEQNKAD